MTLIKSHLPSVDTIPSFWLFGYQTHPVEFYLNAPVELFEPPLRLHVNKHTTH